MPLFCKWIDGREIQPDDNQLVLAYSLIENPEDQLPMFQKLHIRYGNMTISGPSVRRYQKRYVDDGSHTELAFWQAIDDLPK